jgi:RimJ/RimL family protein N-acetyltransferase
LARRAPDSLTSDVRLRDVAEADLPIFFEHQLDPDANRMAAFTARDRDAFMAHWARILGDESVITKTVVFDGHVAGNVLSFEQSGQPLVGYWIGKEYWGKGVATRALSEFLGYVKVRPLYARVAKHNAGSIRVLEKCGFKICDEDNALSDAPGDEVEEFLFVLGVEEHRPRSGLTDRDLGTSSE